MTQLLIDRATLEQLVVALEKHHKQETRYSDNKRRANATCAHFTVNPLQELAEQAYMLTHGQETIEALTAGRAALAQQELPQKERPDFMAGYDAGMADAKRMAQQGEPVAQARLGMKDGIAMALSVVELYGMKGDVIYREIAKLRDGIAAAPAPQAQDALQDIAAYIGVGGYNGATTEQLSERIRVEFDRLAALQSAQPKQELLRDLTDEEILSLEKQTPAMNDAGEEWIYFARAVLKKAKE